MLQTKPIWWAHPPRKCETDAHRNLSCPRPIVPRHYRPQAAARRAPKRPLNSMKAADRKLANGAVQLANSTVCPITGQGSHVVTEAQFEYPVVAHRGAFPSQAREFVCAQPGKQRFEAGAQ